MNTVQNRKLKNLTNKRYIVTGAAGHLGSTIMGNLRKLECEAYGLLLHGECPKVSDSNLNYFYGDICDIESIRCLFDNPDEKELIVIHTAALISIAKKIPPKLYQVNVNGVKNIVQLCKEYSARLVHVSSVHAIPELPKGQIMEEVQFFSPDLVVGGYAKTKAEAVQIVLDEVAHDALDAVVVFPSGIIGPYDEGNNHLIQMVKDYISGTLLAGVEGGYNFVDVRDVADGCILAGEFGRSGEGYILGGHQLSIRQLLGLVSNKSKKKPAGIVPISVAKVAVSLIEGFAKLCHQRPLYTRYSLHTLESNSEFSSQKAVRELGYSVRGAKETVSDMVDWLNEA